MSPYNCLWRLHPNKEYIYTSGVGVKTTVWESGMGTEKDKRIGDKVFLRTWRYEL